MKKFLRIVSLFALILSLFNSNSFANNSLYILNNNVAGYSNAQDAQNRRNSRTTYTKGDYFVYKRFNGMINISRKVGTPGVWINPADNKVVNNTQTTNTNSATTDQDKGTTYVVANTIAGYNSAMDAKNRTNQRTTYPKGTYFVFRRFNGMINISRKQGTPGIWINPSNAQVSTNSNTTPAPTTTNNSQVTIPPTNTYSNSVYYIGDSLAAGSELQSGGILYITEEPWGKDGPTKTNVRPSGIPGQIVGGSNPEGILLMIKRNHHSTVKGKTIALSTGASNSRLRTNYGLSSVYYNAILEQVRTLKKFGANVIVLGISNNIFGDWNLGKKVNSQLAEIANRENVRFEGGFTSNDGGALVHGRYPWVNKYKSLGKLTNTSTVSTPYNNVSNSNTFVVNKTTYGYNNAYDAKQGLNVKSTLPFGTYFVYKTHNGMINISTVQGKPGSWINPNR